MNLGKLKIRDYLSYNFAEIDFTKVRKALIVGMNNGDVSDSNGSGKTNLFEAIGWNGWGESKASTIDLNVKDGKDSCIVEHEFEHDGKNVKIIRGRNKKSSLTTLDFYIDGQVSNGANVTETNKKIKDFLNLDYTTFVNSVYIKQDDVNSLANTTRPNEGRELLEKVLNLVKYDDFHERAKEEYKTLLEEKRILEESISTKESLENILAEALVKIEDAETTISNLEADLTTVKKELVEYRETYDVIQNKYSSVAGLQRNKTSLTSQLVNLNRELESATEDANAYKNSLADKKKGLEDDISAKQQSLEKEDIEAIKAESEKYKILAEEAERKVNEEEDKIRGLKGEYALLTAKDMDLNEDKERKEEELKSIKLKIKNPTITPGEKCDNCLNDFTENSFEHYVDHLKEKGNVAFKELSNIESKLQESKSKQEEILLKLEATNATTLRLDLIDKQSKIVAQGAIEAKQKLIDQINSEIKKMTEDIGYIDSGEGLDRWKSLVKTKKEEVATRQGELDKVNESLELLDKNPQELEDENRSIKEKIASHESSIEAHNRNIAYAKSNLSSYTQIVTDTQQSLSDIEHKISQVDEKNEILAVYGDVMDAFSSRGIRSYILETALEELEGEANSILSKLSNGRLSITFQTKKEIKKSKAEKHEKLVFEVLINDGQKTFPFTSYSGGEKFRISFVLRVALSKLLLRRSKSKLEFLIIDEAVSPLDGNGVEKIMEIINELQNDFATILVITHRNDIKNYFDEVITIEKNEEGSRIV